MDTTDVKKIAQDVIITAYLGTPKQLRELFAEMKATSSEEEVTAFREKLCKFLNDEHASHSVVVITLIEELTALILDYHGCLDDEEENGNTKVEQ